MAGDGAAGAPAGKDALAAVAALFWRWFKEDAGEHNEALAGAVHFLSDPKVSDGAVTFAVDRGTAPVESFEDLLDALEMMGAKHCEIGHREG